MPKERLAHVERDVQWADDWPNGFNLVGDSRVRLIEFPDVAAANADGEAEELDAWVVHAPKNTVLVNVALELFV